MALGTQEPRIFADTSFGIIIVHAGNEGDELESAVREDEREYASIDPPNKDLDPGRSEIRIGFPFGECGSSCLGSRSGNRGHEHDGGAPPSDHSSCATVTRWRMVLSGLVAELALAPAPVVERIAPVFAAYEAQAPMVEYTAPVPAVHSAPAPIVKGCLRQQSSAQ